MSESLLKTITTGKIKKPIFIVLYGVDGVGKSEFGSKAPAPIFLGTEEGSSHLDVARFKVAESLFEFDSQLRALFQEKHEYKTAVIDTLDWLEPLIWAEVCREGNVRSIEDYGGGYGKGYARAYELWCDMIKKFGRLSDKMNVVLVAHAMIKTFTDPSQPAPYDRYQLKLQAKSDGKNDVSAKLREAVQCVLFATYDITVVTEKGDKKGRGVGDGERVLYTERRPSFDAKNRFRLPFEMPLSWQAFQEGVDSYYADKAINN